MLGQTVPSTSSSNREGTIATIVLCIKLILTHPWSCSFCYCLAVGLVRARLESWACGTDERLPRGPRHFQSPTYVDPWAAQGLETPPRMSTSHLASDPKRRPPSAQPRTQLSMATCPGQRTIKPTRGNGYAPAWGSLVMMMKTGVYFLLKLLDHCNERALYNCVSGILS